MVENDSDGGMRVMADARFSSVADDDGIRKQPHRWKIFESWCKATTTHGVADAWGDQQCGRIFFGCLVIVMLAMAVFQVAILILTFFTAPYFESAMIVDQEEYMLFPNVTVCNQNRINNTKLTELGIIGENTRAMEHLFLSQLVSYTFLKAADDPLYSTRKEAWHNVKQIFEATNRSNLKDPNELLRFLGHECEKTLMLCQMNQDYFDCCAKATAVINAEYGLCWIVPIPSNKGHGRQVQLMPGITTGLRLRIQPRIEDYYDSIINNYIERGVILNVNFNPYLTLYPNPIPIAPGMRARITIAKQKMEYVVPFFSPFSPDCTQNRSNRIAKGPYDREQCAVDCILEFVNEVAGCYMVGDRVVDGKTCDPDDAVEMFFPRFSSYLRIGESGKSAHDRCSEKCKDPCGPKTNINTNTMIDSFPAPNYLDDIAVLVGGSNDTKTVDMVKETIMADIYYSSRAITSVQMKEKSTIFELISNIGGQLGIWLGASIVTFVQLLYYCGVWTFRWQR